MQGRMRNPRDPIGGQDDETEEPDRVWFATRWTDLTLGRLTVGRHVNRDGALPVVRNHLPGERVVGNRSWIRLLGSQQDPDEWGAIHRRSIDAGMLGGERVAEFGSEAHPACVPAAAAVDGR